MNEDEFRLVHSQRLETGANGNLPGRSSKDRGEHVKTGSGTVVEVPVVRVDHRLDERDFCMSSKQSQARAYRGTAGQIPVLLRDIAARPQPAPGCHHHGCDRACHLIRAQK